MTTETGMRTLGEIIEAAKSGDMPTHDECYWAMLALTALTPLDHSNLRTLADKTGSIGALLMSERHKRWHTALNTDPQKYLGPNNDPANPEYQKMRKLSLRLAEKAAKGELPNQKKS